MIETLAFDVKESMFFVNQKTLGMSRSLFLRGNCAFSIGQNKKVLDSRK